MSRDPQCIFCRIVAGEIPASIIHRDDDCVAFLDIAPLSDGHVLVIPVFHAPRLVELPELHVARLSAVLPRIGRAVLQSTKAEGFNLLLNEGPVAGQVVNHAHVHLIPRRSGDQLGYRWNAGKYPPGRDTELAASLRAALNSR
jgi:histidine triad (HIT) family protein